MTSTATTTITRHLVTRGEGSTRVDVTLPEPAAGEVRIRVAAAPVNPVDVQTRDGVFHAAGFIPEGASAGLGWDLAGTVEAVGADAGGLQPGDEVIALSDDFAAPLRAHAEAIVLPVRAVGRAPRGLDAAAASTLPVNALTAHQALDLLGLVAGDSVLITGAAGAVGGFAVELAKLRGLRVVAAASERDHEWLRSIGADEVAGRDARPGAPVDGALDAAELGAPALAAVRDGGAFVGVTVPATPEAERGIAVQTVYVHAEHGQLDELSRLAEAGRLTTRVAQTVPFERADEAYARVAAGGLRGRVVLTFS